MDRAFHRFYMQCRRRKPPRMFGQVFRLCPDKKTTANLVGIDGASDELVVRQELETGVRLKRQTDAYDAGGTQLSNLQSSMWVQTGTTLQCLMRAKDASASWRNYSSSAGNSARAPSKWQQCLDFVKLKATAHLESIPKRAYLRSLENILKTTPELEGDVGNVMKQIEEKYEEALKRHGDLAKDSRGASHLQMASLALASYRTLLPHFAHNRAVTADLIKEPIGAAAADTLNFMSRFVLFLSFDKFGHVSRGLDYLGRDFGRSFETEAQKEPGCHSLKVTRCLYNTFFELEGEPDLTRLFCAFDRMWFDHISPHRDGIEFSRSSTLADGAPFCDFVVRRKKL